MATPLAKRFAKAFAAQGFGQLINVLIQALSVPLFLSAWGKVRFGEWIVLSAIPAYLTVADLSFGAAASNEMTVLAGAGDRERVQSVYRSTWVLVLAISGAVLVLGSALTLILPFDRWLGLRSLRHEEVVIATLLLLGQVVLSQQGSIFKAAYRAGGLYAAGVFTGNLVRLAEFGALLAVLLTGRGIVALSFWVLAVRALGYAINYAHLKRAVPWLSLGFRGFDREVLKPLIAPALSYNAIPLGMATNLQGTLFVANALFGPGAVVALSTMRTMTRFVWQAVTLVTNAVWPEFSRALGANDMELARTLHRRCCQIGTWIAIVGSITMLVAGPWIYPHWTGGRIALDYPVFAWLLFGIVVNSLWSVSYIVSVSINRHVGISVAYLALSVAGIAASAGFGRILGLQGVAIGLVLVDAAMVYFAVSASFRILREPLSAYPSLVKPPFGWIAGILASALRRPSAVS